MASPLAPARRIWEISICGCAFVASKISATRNAGTAIALTIRFPERKAAQREDAARECGRCERDVYDFLFFSQDISVRTRRSNTEKEAK
jgi:hypothetical protein